MSQRNWPRVGAAHRHERRRSRSCATTRKNKQLTNFSDLGLAAPILKALQDEGYTTPTPIQAQGHPGRADAAATCSASPRPAPARPPHSRCRSCIASPPTAARALRKGCRVLVLTPTRELATQIARELPHLRPASRPHRGGRVRRRRPSAADPGAGARRRRAGRHAGPAARPHSASATSCWRAPRSSCSTRPTRCSTWASCRRSAASSPSSRRSGRTCSSRRPCRARSASWPTSCCAIRSGSR